jgi:DNA-binding MarR family transcriptional regulator
MSSPIVSLAEFRYRLRTFLRFSEDAARAVGLEPQQHQLLLVVESLHEIGRPPLIKTVAERLQLRHHSVVGLVDRLEGRRLLVRKHDSDDHRQILLHLTAEGRELLRRLSDVHEQELRLLGPELIAQLEAIIAPAVKSGASRS